MTTAATHVTIQRLLQKLLSDELPNLSPQEKAAFEQRFEDFFTEQMDRSSDSSNSNFASLIGIGPEGVKPFDDLPYPKLNTDFDAAISYSNVVAAADLYAVYMHETMRIFPVVDMLRRLYAMGRIRIQQGPGARSLYLLEKWMPLRYTKRDRMLAYRRVFNYGSVPTPNGTVINRGFNHQFVAFVSAMAQYFRDLVIGEVIRGSTEIGDRPFGTIATVQRLGTDLRYALDRASYGNILALTRETTDYLHTCMELLDAPDIKKAFDANNKWEVVEQVSIRYLGGVADLSHRAKMAESGRRLLQFVGANEFPTNQDPDVFRVQAKPMAAHAEAWIAAFRMTDEGKRFPGIDRSLRWAVGLGDAPSRSAMSF